MRTVLAKAGMIEGGIGSVACTPIWESDPSNYGDFARIDRAWDGRLFVTITDMEDFDGAFSSVEITPECLRRLQQASAEPTVEHLVSLNRERLALNQDRYLRTDFLALFKTTPAYEIDLWRVVPGASDEKVEGDWVDVWNGARFFTAPRYINGSQTPILGPAPDLRAHRRLKDDEARIIERISK